MADELRARYLAYLDTLNARRFDDLDALVHDQLTYDDEPWSRQRYADRLRQDVVTIPDLRYTLLDLVVADDEVAARLWFDCHPRGDFLGVATDGRRVRFAEHVFYRFRAGRIAQVWSLIDTEAVRRQLHVT